MTVRSVVQMYARGGRRFTPGTSAIAQAEGLVGHARAMDARADEAEVAAREPAAEPRPGLRDVEPYVSPQLDVAGAPQHERVPACRCRTAFADDLAEAVRDLSAATATPTGR